MSTKSALYHILLVSDNEDIIVLAGKLCIKCLESKLHCRILQTWPSTIAGIKEWKPLGVRGVKHNCKC